MLLANIPRFQGRGIICKTSIMESTISVELVKVAIVALGLILADIRLTHSYGMHSCSIWLKFSCIEWFHIYIYKYIWIILLGALILTLAMSAIVMGATFYKFVMKRNYLSPPTSSQTMPNFLLMASIIQVSYLTFFY